jgi:hypothetical protein
VLVGLARHGTDDQEVNDWSSSETLARTFKSLKKSFAQALNLTFPKSFVRTFARSVRLTKNSNI